MSAQEIIAPAIYREFENRPRYAQAQMNGIIADECAVAAVDALTAAGYRIIGPGEFDRETLERAAEVATNRFDLRHNARVRYAGVAIATAIRALAGKAGEA